jgi:hypothetical protein
MNMQRQEITVADIDAAADVIAQVKENSDQVAFELAAGQRAALIRVKKAAEEAIAMLETELLRQVEKNPRSVGGLTYTRGPKKVTSWSHELILDRAWKKALADSTNQQDGTIDWDHLGQAIRELVTDLYLSPSVKAKTGGLSYVGLKPADVSTETTKGTVLVVVGDAE